jgi:hypothetical protein
MLYLLHLDVSKLDRVLNFSSSSFCCLALVKRGKTEAVPTGMGGPHVLASGHSRRDVGGQVRDTEPLFAYTAVSAVYTACKRYSMGNRVGRLAV